MEKVHCINSECEEYKQRGYTASPHIVRCSKCKGELVIVNEENHQIEVNHDIYAHIA